MKKYIIVLLSVSCLILLSSCSKDGGSGSSGGIVGTWKTNSVEYTFKGEAVPIEPTRYETYTFTFNDDGTCYYDGEECEYKYSGSTLYFKVDGYTMEQWTVDKLTSTDLHLRSEYGDCGASYRKVLGEYKNTTLYSQRGTDDLGDSSISACYYEGDIAMRVLGSKISGDGKSFSDYAFRDGERQLMKKQ